MSTPLIRDGAIAVAGNKIEAIGPAEEILARFQRGEVIDLGQSIILPGLINAHTHLELSDCQAHPLGDSSFTDWILNMRGHSASKAPDFASATQRGIDQCLQFGITCVGDISQQSDISRSVIKDSPLKAVSFGEVLGLAQRRLRFDELFPKALSAKYANEHLRIGISPHAPYTVDLDGYRQCIQAAKSLDLPLATHLSETSDEGAFITSHSGPFRELWETIGSWKEPVSTFKGSPIEMAKAIGLLDFPSVLAHVNYCDDAELDMLATGQASVVYCPRTHQYFGHSPHRWQEMLARGINVAVGTDSCASSPNLNLVDDLRLLARVSPDFPSLELWKLATVRAAMVLSWPGIGALSPGYQADFITFTVSSDDPLTEVLLNDMATSGTWIEGVKVH